MTQLTKKSYTQPEKLMAILFVVAAVVVVYGISQFMGHKMKISANEAAQINYEMAKAKSAEGLYSLENREIEISYKALEAKKAAVKAAAAQKEAVKKAQTAAQKKQAAAQKQAQQRQQQALQKRAQAAKAAAMKSAELKAQAEVMEKLDSAKNATSSGSAYANAKAAPEATPNESSEVKHKSFDEWKNEIFAARTREIIVQFTVAYKKGEVTESDFQKLVDDMLNHDEDIIVGLGLYALRINPSVNSFAKLVQIQSSVNTTYSAYIQQTLMSYHQSSGLGILKQTLSNTNRAVVVKALEVIRLGVSNIRSGTINTMIDPRYIRNDNQGQFSISNYLSFLPILRNLALNTEDPEIANLAQLSVNIIGSQNVATN